MRFNVLILFFLIFNSCTQTQQKIETNELESMHSIADIVIPIVEKNSSDVNFKLANGVLLFDDVPYTGYVNEFYENEKLKSKSQYFEGKRQGYFNGWYSSGNKWFERFYNNGMKVGVHLGWYDSKLKKFEYHFNNYGSYEGSVKEWHSNGNLAKHFNFKKGKERGSQKNVETKRKYQSQFL